MQSWDESLTQNLSDEEALARAIAEIEHTLSSEQPLVMAADQRERTRKRHRFAVPIGLSLVLVSGLAAAVALSPAFPGVSGPNWQSGRR